MRLHEMRPSVGNSPGFRTPSMWEKGFGKNTRPISWSAKSIHSERVNTKAKSGNSLCLETLQVEILPHIQEKKKSLYKTNVEQRFFRYGSWNWHYCPKQVPWWERRPHYLLARNISAVESNHTHILPSRIEARIRQPIEKTWGDLTKKIDAEPHQTVPAAMRS